MNDGLFCSAGNNFFSIGNEGNIYVCNLLMYNQDGYLGNIFKDDLKFNTQNYSRCLLQKCESGCDRQWTKKIVYDKDNILHTKDLDFPALFLKFKNPVTIVWAPTWKCNYECIYCSLRHSYNSGPEKTNYTTLEYSYEKWIEAFDKFIINNNFEGGLLQLSGGEPTFYKDINKIFTFFSKKNFLIGLATNLSGNIYNNIIQAAPPEAYGGINCSVHVSDKTFNMDLFKSKILLLKSMNYPITVTLVGHPNQIMLAPELYDYFNSRGIAFTVIPMVGNFNDVYFKTIEDYPEPLKSIIYKYSAKHVLDDNRYLDGKPVK